MVSKSTTKKANFDMPWSWCFALSLWCCVFLILWRVGCRCEFQVPVHAGGMYWRQKDKILDLLICIYGTNHRTELAIILLRQAICMFFILWEEDSTGYRDGVYRSRHERCREWSLPSVRHAGIWKKARSLWEGYNLFVVTQPTAKLPPGEVCLKMENPSICWQQAAFARR